MQNDLTIADIERSFFEYRANFKQPITSLWQEVHRGEIISALYKAMSPWGIDLDNITWNQAAKSLSEVQLSVTVPSFFAGIQIGVGWLTMSVANPDWTRAPQIISLFQTAVDTVKDVAAQELQSQQTALGFHVRPSKKPFREIVGRFVNLKMLQSEDARMFGVSVYYDDFSFVVDSSALVRDGVFVKLSRMFADTTRFEEMANRIYKDEETVLNLLGLKIQ
ncbi:MAG: hypothetical protein EHM23_26275 [Acidobacteria bacterium]|nr:MAG: hypothetical protein EHM23_26275 [Acidobacteriota bacterium]